MIEFSKKLIGDLIENSFKKVSSSIENALSNSDRPLNELFFAWINEKSRFPSITHPVARPPATLDEIKAAEARLGIKLPDQLAELYSISNGVEWVIPPGDYLLPLQGQFPSISELCLAGDLKTPLSRLTYKCWNDSWKSDGVDEIVSVHRPALAAHMYEAPERTLTFAELDKFLAIQKPPKTSCLIMSIDASSGIPAGSVLEVENLIATHFPSLKHWLSINSRPL